MIVWGPRLEPAAEQTPVERLYPERRTCPLKRPDVGAQVPDVEPVTGRGLDQADREVVVGRGVLHGWDALDQGGPILRGWFAVGVGLDFAAVADDVPDAQVELARGVRADLRADGERGTVEL